LITVIGSINLDFVATVEQLPRPGETVPGDSFRTAPGGKGANQALAAARAGAKTRMIGAVGRDAFATQALALLEEGGVDLSGVRTAGASTGIAVILVAGGGENVIAVVPGANGTVVPGDLADLSRGEVLLLQHEIPLPTVEAALNAAHSAGAIALLNTAPFRAEAAGFLGKADYLIANETEFDCYGGLLALAGTDRQARMRSFAEKTGRTVIVTLGRDGALAATPESLLKVPALDINPVDTVGAGDTFCGYLAAGLASGLSLEHGLRRAAVAGSLACLKPGAQPSIPLAEEVERELQASSRAGR
jgi:ribokinase